MPSQPRAPSALENSGSPPDHERARFFVGAIRQATGEDERLPRESR